MSYTILTPNPVGLFEIGDPHLPSQLAWNPPMVAVLKPPQTKTPAPIDTTKIAALVGEYSECTSSSSLRNKSQIKETIPSSSHRQRAFGPPLTTGAREAQFAWKKSRIHGNWGTKMMNHSIKKDIFLHTHHWFMHSMKRLYTPITKLCLLLAIQTQEGWISFECFSIEDMVSTSTCMMMEISSYASPISALSEEIVYPLPTCKSDPGRANLVRMLLRYSEYGTCTYKWRNKCVCMYVCMS